MKKWLVIIVLIILLSFNSYAYCKEVRDGKTILESIELCSGTHNFRKGLKIGADNITLDCGSSIVQGIFQGVTGILIANRKNVVIKNCIIMNYDVAIEVVNSTKIDVTNNAFLRNQIGIKIRDSNNNTFTKNRDVSLRKPIHEIYSSDNFFQYENKKIKGDFCRYNECNERKEEYSLYNVLMRAINLWINTD